jgi:hypothetical protein
MAGVEVEALLGVSRHLSVLLPDSLSQDPYVKLLIFE